jgi:phosphonopyruvate decarboxylase
VISAGQFCADLATRGFTFASGVPCSYFNGPITLLGRQPGRYVPAANEGGALAAAAGAALAGAKSFVLLQNSGFGNLVNPLTSLTTTYRIPVLAFTSLRGWPDPAGDEPQHALMGQATHALLDVLGVAHGTLHAEDGLPEFQALIDDAEKELTAGRPAFVLVAKGAVDSVPADPPHARGLVSREVVRLVAELAQDCLMVASTGFPARELFAADDRPGNFYMQGSMGHASSFGLGVARARQDRTVVVLDGDGSALMHLGALPMIGDNAPPNLLHVVLDNGIHESTGGQPVASGGTSFAGIAAAAGYRTAVTCDSLPTLAMALREALGSAGPHLLAVPTLPRSGVMPPRATAAAPPDELARRFARAAQRRSHSPRGVDDDPHPA